MKIEIGMNVESYEKHWNGFIAVSRTFTGEVVKVNKKSIIVKLTHVLEKHGDDVVVDREYNVPKVKYTYWYTTESGRIIYKSDSKIYGIIEFEETTEDTETAEAETATDTDPDDGAFVYDVVIHNFYGCDTYTVRANGLESAKDKALKIMKNESLEEDYYSIDSIRIYEENSDELLKEIIFEPTETETTETAENDTAYKMTDIQFETFMYQLRCLAPCDFPPAIVLHQASGDMTDKQKKEYSLFLLYKGLAIYHNGEIVTAKGGFHLCTTTLHAKSLLNSAYGITAESVTPTPTDSETTETETKRKPITTDIDMIKDFIKETEAKRKKRKPITTDIDMIKDFTKETETAELANTTPEISNKYDETKELLTVEQFERLTGTLSKSLFKAIGLEETRRIAIIISNNMVYFNYNGTQYKYNPAQCKVYKKDGRKYQRINWKDFTDDNSSTDQKQDRGRSPPLLLI